MLTTKFVFVILNVLYYVNSEKTFQEMNWTGWPAAWADETQDDNDLFFDRIVPIVLDMPNFENSTLERQCIVPGVLIDSYRILTSFNPFREISHDADILGNIVATVLTGRSKTVTNLVNYFGQVYNISCGRQIVYLPDEDISDRLWHGKDRKHSPLHDLMVLRIDGNITDFSNETKYTLQEQFPDAKVSELKPGPFMMDLAKIGDGIGERVKFASLGYRTLKEMEEFDRVRATEYSEDDMVLVDCSYYLPREWGYFICIDNPERFPGLGSGAMLVAKNKLYGVGSFTMFKGGKSILVFTDVRPYYDLIMNTCTIHDTTLDDDKNRTMKY